MIAGSGIGGEYAAINSAIGEMIPARYRGRVDLAVNGTCRAGAFLGTIVTIWALNHITPVRGWRVAFPVGPVLALVIITRSFLYNAIFFTYGLVLEFFFHVKATDTAYYFMAFAAGNLLGPLTLGRLFDTIPHPLAPAPAT